ncbi:AAA-like domain-containing protein [Arthrospira platensis BEA 1257B]
MNPNDGNNIEIPGSPISINSPFYIERPPIEEMGYNELQQPGCVVRIKAPRKMGKSSLLNRMLTQAVSWGYGTVYLNFLEVDAETFNSLEQLVRWFCANATKQLKLPAKLDEYWDIDLGTKVSCRLYFEEYLFITKDTPIVIAMNEVNRLFEYPVIASDFLPMLRSWHELSKHNKLWENLRLIVVHSTEVYVPLQLHQSPFNVGLVLKIPQFTPEQVQDLALRYELSWAAGESGLKRLEGLISMVGGHPYLVQLAFYTISKSGISLENLIKNARKPDGIYSAYLRDLLVTIQQDSDLHIALNKVLKSDNGVPLEAITAYKLESLGLVNFEDNLAQIGCDLYRLYFLEQL